MSPPQLNKDQLALYQESVREFRKTSRILECFYHDHSECNGPIKQSHSIQRNGRLSIIEGMVNSNMVLYAFTEFESDTQYSLKKLKPIGKAKASTFFGFCDYHDKVLFSPIEDYAFNESDKHLFLHSYRAFAHSYHRKKEELKAYSVDSLFTRRLSKGVHSAMVEGIKAGLKDLEFYRKSLSEFISNHQYDSLEYFTFVTDSVIPMASSSLISPEYSYKGHPLNNHLNFDRPFSPIMFTVLPDFDKTIVIFATFQNDVNGVLFLDELDNLSKYELEKLITSCMIYYAENSFISPAFWDKLGHKGQRQLCSELESWGNFFTARTKFPISKLNFFSPCFSMDALTT